MKTFNPIQAAIIASLLIFTWHNTVSAADYTSASFTDAYTDYLEVSDDLGGSAKNVAKAWQSLYDNDSTDPLVLVYLGSSHTMMGRDAMMPWSKLKHSETGLEEMAMALRLLNEDNSNRLFQGMPVYLHVKSIAGITFTQVPEFFGRQEEGFYLLKDSLEDTNFQQLPEQAKTYLYYYGINAAYLLDKKDIAKDWSETLANFEIEDNYTQAAKELGGE